MKIIKNKVQNSILFLSLLVVISPVRALFSSMFQEPVEHHIKIDDCKISESFCNVIIGENKELTINVTPKIAANHPMDINVSLRGVEPDKLTIDFEGVSHSHDIHAYDFNKDRKGQYSTKGFISICSLSTMHWMANLIVVSGNESWKVSFPFAIKGSAAAPALAKKPK